MNTLNLLICTSIAIMTNYASSNWDSTMSGLYRNFVQREQRDTELSSLFSNLRKVLEKKSSYHWHIHSFKQYIRNEMNPLGLRIQIFPTLEDMSVNFKKEWEKNLSKCSTGMMSLLIDEYQRKLIDIEKELERLNKQLIGFKDHALFEQYDRNLNEHLEHYNKEILIKKDKKFFRDRVAFQESKAYNWKTVTTNRNTKRHANNADMLSETSSISSVSSKGSFRRKSTRKTKRDSQGSGSHEKKPKKRITDLHTSTGISISHMVSGKTGGDGSSAPVSTEMNISQTDRSARGTQQPRTQQDNFLVNPIDSTVM